MAGNYFAVVVVYTHIQQNGQQKSSVEQFVITAISLGTHQVLYRAVNAKHPQRFNKQVGEY